LHRTTPVDIHATQLDGSTAFAIEKVPYLEDQRTEICAADGEPIGNIIWDGARPSQICVATDSEEARPFEMIPRGDPATAESFQVLAGDGQYDILWIVDANGLKAHYPVTSRSSDTVPPLVAQYHPKRRRSSVAAHVFRRKTEEAQEMDTMELDTLALPVDAMGRFWVAFVLLEVIRRSKFRIAVEEPGTVAGSTQEQEQEGGQRREKASSSSSSSSSSRWLLRSAPGKSLSIGAMLLPRRWSL